MASDASDHCPLLLQTNLTLSAKPRFHFEIFWPKFSDYQDALKRGWVCPETINDPIRRLDAMFKNLASELKSWAAWRIGIVKEQLLMARAIILKLDQTSECRPLTPQERSLRADLKQKLHDNDQGCATWPKVMPTPSTFTCWPEEEGGETS